MDVFISWSGSQSGKLAETLSTWLQDVIQAVQPFYSKSDIDKGAQWNTEILAALDSAKVGIILLLLTF